MPVVSIIIPVYNAAPFLRRCIDSVLSQTETDWEAILIDDASTDESAALLAQYQAKDKRLLVLSQPENRGQSAARNRGLDIARGQYIAFLDADDWWKPDYLAQHLRAIGDCDVVQSGHYCIKDEAVVQTRHAWHQWQYTVVWARLYRHDAIRGLRFPEHCFYEDVLWTADLFMRQPSIKLIPYTGYYYRYNPNSTTATRHKADYLLIQKLLRKRGMHPALLYTRMKLALHFLFNR